MSEANAGLFIVWRVFQRRSESLAAAFNLTVKYYSFGWEEKSRWHKAYSYIAKTALTLRDLFRSRPRVLFVQLPPTPVLYIAAIYCRLTGCKLVADCHNAMIYSRWLSWPFARYLLTTANTLLVHNKDVEEYAKKLGLDAVTLHDPLPSFSSSSDQGVESRFQFMEGDYVIVPWSFAPDEPVAELIDAAASMPEVNFVMTWFAERLPVARTSLPENLVLTGYLDDSDFTAVFAQATAALVLTTREGTQPSGATEAIALGVPLILSDLGTTRRLYDDMPIYVANTADGIRSGIQQALTERNALKEKVWAFRGTLIQRLETEVADVKSLLLTSETSS